MDLATLIQKVLDIVAKVRAATTFADYLALIPDVLDIIKAITGALMPPVKMGAAPRPAFAAADGKGIDDVLADIEACCAQHKGAAQAGAAPTGPFVDMLLPLLLALLKKLLGG